MPIATTPNRVSYSGNGSSAVFSFPYEFHAQADLDVYIWNSSRIFPISSKTLGVDFSISGTQDQQNRYVNGASVIFNSTPAVGDQIVIVRDMSPTQPFNLFLGQNIPSPELIKCLDRLVLIEQRLNDLTSRSFRLADAYPLSFDPTLPAKLTPGAPLIIGSSGLTTELGVVAVAGSSAATYFGILPVPNGGTGLDFSLLTGIILSPGNNTTFERIQFAQEGFVLSSHGSSNPSFGLLSATQVGSGVLAAQFGGTGTNSSFQQNAIVFQETPTSFGQVPSGPIGFVLTSNGSSAPNYQALSATIINSGIVITAHGGTGSELPYNAQGVVYMSSATQMASSQAGGNDQPLIGNTGTAPSFRPINLASNSSVTNILQQINGGTGTASSFPTAGVIYQQSSGAYGFIPSSSEGRVLTCHGSSAPSFDVSAPTPVIPSTITGNTTLTTAVKDVIANSSLYDIRLYDAVGNGGREIKIFRTNNDLQNRIRIIGSGAQTIGTFGTSVGLFTIGETFKLVSDNVNWRIEHHQTETGWINYDPANLGFGTMTDKNYWWRRTADGISLRGYHVNGTATAVTAVIAFPTGATIGHPKLGVARNHSFGTVFGGITATVQGVPATNRGPWNVIYHSSTTTGVCVSEQLDLDFATWVPIIASTTFGNNSGFLIDAKDIPILEWIP